MISNQIHFLRHKQQKIKKVITTHLFPQFFYLPQFLMRLLQYLMKKINLVFPGQTPIDPSFTTPKKQAASKSFHSYLPQFVSSKLKDIAQKIRSSANKRFRMRDQGGQIKLVFWSEMKEVSESTQTTSREKRSYKDLTPYQLDKLIKNKRVAVSKMETSHNEKYKQIKELFKCLQMVVFKNNDLRSQLKLVRDQNQNTKQMTKYGLFLKQLNQQQHDVVKKLHNWVQLAQQERQKIVKRITRIPIFDQLIARKKNQNNLLKSELSRWRQEIQKMIDDSIPFSMVNCMFQVGILNQQIFILVQQKKQKLKQKEFNKLSKATQILSRRDIHIQCLGSQIIEYNTLVAIYMHSKSLTIPNILTLMNELSFFSTEFKQYYDFPLLETYIKKSIIYNSIQPQFKEAQILKKRLKIFVKGEHEAFLRSILRIFQRQSKQYSIYLNPMIMKIQIAIEQNQPCNKVEERDPNTSDQSEIRIHFHGLCFQK